MLQTESILAHTFKVLELVFFLRASEWQVGSIAPLLDEAVHVVLDQDAPNEAGIIKTTLFGAML